MKSPYAVTLMAAMVLSTTIDFAIAAPQIRPRGSIEIDMPIPSFDGDTPIGGGGGSFDASGTTDDGGGGFANEVCVIVYNPVVSTISTAKDPLAQCQSTSTGPWSATVGASPGRNGFAAWAKFQMSGGTEEWSVAYRNFNAVPRTRMVYQSRRHFSLFDLLCGRSRRAATCCIVEQPVKCTPLTNRLKIISPPILNPVTVGADNKFVAHGHKSPNATDVYVKTFTASPTIRLNPTLEPATTHLSGLSGTTNWSCQVSADGATAGSTVKHWIAVWQSRNIAHEEWEVELRPFFAAK